ncbi:MAG: Uma2 family endonuclease [Blastocatellia bacterium]
MRTEQTPNRPRLVKPPRLNQGDRLTREEFERRYDAMPNLNKAELIEGVVYLPSPVRHVEHGKPHGILTTWIGTYCAFTPQTDFSDNATIRLDEINDPQPDAVMFISEAAGGRARIGEDRYIEGAPELVVEVAASTAAYDLHDKLRAYERNGVREYIVWRTEDGELDWFRLRGKKYVRIQPDVKGVITSSVFPGLRLNVDALLNNEMKIVLEELQKGLKSKEHADFVKRLSQKSMRKPKRG